MTTSVPVRTSWPGSNQPVIGRRSCSAGAACGGVGGVDTAAGLGRKGRGNLGRGAGRRKRRGLATSSSCPFIHSVSESPRPAPPAPTTPVGERRYTEEELALILNRAAERQEGMQASAPRYTLADIQEIAAGAGIAPDHVASVAATLGDARAPRGGGVLGAPHRCRFEDSIEGEVADEVIGELFDLVRRTLGQQGEVTEALGTVEWKAQDAFGHSYVT